MVSTLRFSVLFFILLAFQFLGSSCSCQRTENIDAKKRLTAAVKEDPMIAVAAEEVRASDLNESEKDLKRVTTMPFKERWLRLGSFKFKSSAKLTFQRDSTKIESSEKTELRVDSDDNFRLRTVMGQGGEQELASINSVFYLKNRNGKWRISRDPTGERLVFLEDATAVWPSFYKLLKKNMTLSEASEEELNGRDVYVYDLLIAKNGDEARSVGAALVAEVPKRVALSQLHGKSDAEVLPDETLAEKKVRMQRLLKARERALGGGGQGKLWVDAETGVWLKVKLDADIIIGDTPQTSTLEVRILAEISEIGEEQVIEPPKSAIEEFSRKKWPVKVRKRLEDKNIVAPLPKEEKAH